MQLDYYSSKFQKRQFPITIVSENVANAPNIGSLFRTADAFGIEQLILCGSHIPMGRKMSKTSRSTEKSVPFEIHENSDQVISDLKSKGYLIIALEITSNSIALSEFKFNLNQPIALIIGDEKFGVSESCLQLCDHVVHIEMFGQNSSMNVVQATSVTLYEITKQLN
ncbi:TrmH family RNA methyltransferase [Psychroserpens sp.]|uniref:TrmH family RNA methyltransferase n=1 Tax=Psychroserpens sp. TaxID=2020870 RepID=UPI001B05A239|nr:TrmH family RNA methyltransferase [Psychroserpens sp.]MBO6606368.1 TrmH family RNA methyltransferase [Psychroserpens sp.]MBO6632641.1 TrmH family RNA methyltransferase [Psychroserpens sp.]MBO6653072.1 TrmH family RNA methyltransferase [Psychroserpens sp.]MBO6680900.1 TrmH family RNA methyltransferase [Psychroserpens sp.]MBO6750142.1 TrmH family RNA methyltransferase [Psychroserpens sp.]